MSSIHENNERNQFIANVIKSIQMNTDDFMINLANDDPYEKLIYTWIIKFYEEGKSTVSTVLYIHNQKMQLLQRSLKEFDVNKEKTSQNHQRVMQGIEKNSSYIKLSEERKQLIQNKIDALVNTNLYIASEIITFIVGLIETENSNSLSEPEKYQKKKDHGSNFSFHAKLSLETKLTNNGIWPASFG